MSFEKITRKEFLKLSSGVVVVGSLAAGGWGITEIVAGDGPADNWHKSVCRYCGTGCGVQIGTRKGRVVRIKGDEEAHNQGVICIKGSTLATMVNNRQNRVRKPKIRKNGKLVEASWEEAMSLATQKFKENIQNNGADSVAFYGSGQLFTEESYTANKLFKAGIGTNNVDGNPRLCMASAAVGYVQSFGKDEPAGAYEDIDHADLFFLIGSNTYECHPPLWHRIQMRKEINPETKIIVVDPRRTPTAERADFHLPVIPGTDMLLLNAMCQVIVEDELYSPEFINKHIVFNDGAKEVSFDDYRTFLQDYAPEKVEKELGVSAHIIREMAYRFANANASMSLWTMGINQRTQGVFLNNTLNSLHLITGQICRPGATPMSLTGQSNACGGVRDTGSLSHILPNSRLIKKKEDRREMEEIWNVPEGTISPNPGYNAVDLFQAMYDEKVKAGLIMCTNPAQSIPDLSHYREGMEKCFLVVSEAFETAETVKYADILLPAALYVEKTGVYGQSERRYQLIEQLIPPFAESRSDLDILTDFAERMGYGDLISAKTPQEVWEEWRKVSSHSKYNFEGITYERMKEKRGLQWPCPSTNHPGTVRRYTAEDPFVKNNQQVDFYGYPDHKARVFLRHYIPSPEKSDSQFPFYLTTGRYLEHWHTGTMTMEVDELRYAHKRARLLLNPADAQQLYLKTGDKIRVTSRYGSITEKVEISETESKGTIFAAFFDKKFLVNNIVSDHYDPVSKEPEYKVTAVNIQKVESV